MAASQTFAAGIERPLYIGPILLTGWEHLPLLTLYAMLAQSAETGRLAAYHIQPCKLEVLTCSGIRVVRCELGTVRVMLKARTSKKRISSGPFSSSVAKGIQVLSQIVVEVSSKLLADVTNLVTRLYRDERR